MTKTKKLFAKRLVAIIIALSTLVTLILFNTISVCAATVNTKYPTKNIKGYIISTNNKTAIAYSNSGCTSKIGYIYSTDDCAIQQIYTNGIVKVKAPWAGYSNGRIVYTKLSYFFQNTSTVSTKKATVKTKCYSRSNLKTSLGYVYVGDGCYIVGTSGNYYQVLCPWSGGIYRICWVNKSAFGHTHSYTTVGYEAVHPHKQYKKCNCGASYYTGLTQKVSSCKTCYPSKSYTAWVNTSSVPLVLRKSASTSSAALANMPKGSQITVLDNKIKTNGFYHVIYNEKTGYASANYISFTKPNTPNYDTTNTSSSTYSISGNVVTLKGVRLYEYPIGSYVPNYSYYFNVNGKSTYVGATQCYGFACYCERKLYGSCAHNNSTHFPNLSGSTYVYPNAPQLKSLITRAGAGAHLRTNNLPGRNYGHSMVIAGVTDSGFTVLDANSSGNCKVELRTYTWNGYLTTNYGKAGIRFIEIYK